MNPGFHNIPHLEHTGIVILGRSPCCKRSSVDSFLSASPHFKFCVTCKISLAIDIIVCPTTGCAMHHPLHSRHDIIYIHIWAWVLSLVEAVILHFRLHEQTPMLLKQSSTTLGLGFWYMRIVGDAGLSPLALASLWMHNLTLNEEGKEGAEMGGPCNTYMFMCGKV